MFWVDGVLMSLFLSNCLADESDNFREADTNEIRETFALTS